MRSVAKIIPSTLISVFASIAILWAQQPCQPPSLDLTQSGPNIFSIQQERELGEIIAQRLTYLRITDDPAVTSYIRRTGDRLARYLPHRGLPFRYFVTESSLPDAFSIPGGRIYITRGLIAQLRSPDGLAAVLGHEMGHIVTHQGAIELTFLLKQVLGVSQVTDRQDIQEKFDDLAANWRRSRAAFRRVARRRGPDQLIADQVALYAMAAAGYSAEAWPAFFKRITLTGNSAGNWLSDLFHTTKPDQLRLRDLMNAEEAMPKACIEQSPRADVPAFQRWRKTVLDFTGWGKRVADLHGVIARVKLQPLTLRTVKAVRFSPNGKFLLAQKDRNIYIFTRAPFAFAFRIYAPDARQPRFTPDSLSVVFTGTASRVQVWDVASRKRVLSYIPQLPSPCVMSDLSPDAKELACLRSDSVLDLIQLPSGKTVLERAGFATRAKRKWGVVLPPRASLAFSPDGHYFLASSQNNIVALDLSVLTTVALPRKLKRRLGGWFEFLSDNRLLIFDPFNSDSPDIQRAYDLMLESPSGFSISDLNMLNELRIFPPMPPSVVYKFPSGKVVRQVPMSFGSRVVPVTRGDYLLLGPAQKHPLEISSLTVGKRTLLLDQPAADVYNRIYAHQLLGGDLGIYSLDTGTLQSRAAFPPGGSDAYFRAMASPDLKWVATPAGAIWNLANGKMVQHLRTFYGGSFDGDKAFYGDFPGHRGTHRALIRIDLVNGNITGVREITDAKANLSGLYFVVTEPHQTKPTQGLFSPCRWKFPDFEPMDCDVTYEIRDALNGRTLWSRAFEKEAPDFQVEPEQGRMVVSWAASDAAVGDEINKLPQLKNKWDTVRKQPGEDFVEILHLSNGSVRHAMFVNGGIEGSFLTAGQHLLAVHSGYIEIYSLATGAKEGEIPGGPGAVSSSGSLLASSGDAANKLNIYDLQSRDRLDRFTFPDDVDFEQFSSTGNRLLVLTQDQTAYILDVPAVKEHISNR